MRDYSQILRGGQQGNNQQSQQWQQGQGQGSRRSRRNRQQQQQQFQQQQQLGQQGGGQIRQGSKQAQFALANTLGASAEAAAGLGVSRRVAHRIVDTAYQTRTGGSQTQLT